MTAISYSYLLNRAKSDAQEYMPEFPKTGTIESWQTFLDAVESIEPGEAAHESADSWDWVIYHGKALELCAVLPRSVVGEAESMMLECGSVGEAFENGGLGGVASLIAYWVVYQAVLDEVEALQEELIDLAQSQIDNLES